MMKRFFIVALLSVPGILCAQSQAVQQGQTPSVPGVTTATNDPTCVQLFNLSKGSQGLSTNNAITPEACAAYKFLIPRYTVGPRSAGCVNQTSGITGLNPDFAIRLAKLLQAAPMYIGINSALRPRACQGSTNPESNHIYGCAVDLGYSQDSCSSSACQWIQQNAPNAPYKIQIRMPYSPEWNHVEPIDKEACRAGGPGNPNITGGTTYPTNTAGGNNNGNSLGSLFQQQPQQTTPQQIPYQQSNQTQPTYSQNQSGSNGSTGNSTQSSTQGAAQSSYSTGASTQTGTTQTGRTITLNSSTQNNSAQSGTTQTTKTTSTVTANNFPETKFATTFGSSTFSFASTTGTTIKTKTIELLTRLRDLLVRLLNILRGKSDKLAPTTTTEPSENNIED